MKAIAVLLILACAIAGCSVEARKLGRLRTVLAAREKARASVELEQYMQLRAQVLGPIKQVVAEAGATESEVATIMSAVAIRNARFEAAVGLTIQKNIAAMTWVLTETIHRIICVAKEIRKSERPIPSFETIVGDLFALPGSAYDNKMIQEKADKPATKIEFIKLDADRSGPFLTAKFPQNVHDLFEVVENSGNYRELAHVIARLGLIAEGYTKEQTLSWYPKSWRGLLWSQERVTPQNPILLNRCQFNFDHWRAELANLAANPADAGKKTLIAPLPGSEVIGARKPGFKINPHAVPGAPKPAKTLLTNNVYKSLGMPALSPRETAFFKKNIFTTATFDDNTPMPWSPGAYMTEFKADPANAEWLKNMDAQGLMKDAGPSGTTDEIMQAGDYVSINKDVYGACALRDVASATMHVQLHHSYGEVFQGATASDRMTPAFSWEDPYLALKACPARSRTLRAIPEVWPRKYGQSIREHTPQPPHSIDHYNDAMHLYAELTTNPTSPLAKAIQATDFGSGSERNHPFAPSAEAENADRLIEAFLCHQTKSNAQAPGNLLKAVICSVRGWAKKPHSTVVKADAAL